MDLALYHPAFGYYVTAPEPTCTSEATSGSDAPPSRIGWSGDFFTNTDVHPIFAQALAHQLRQVDQLLGEPTPLHLIEMGPGKGFLIRDLLHHCHATWPSLFHRLHVHLIEQSPILTATQQHTLAAWAAIPSKLTWHASIESLPPASVTGLVLSNELVDAFPVHVLRVDQGKVQEVYVASVDDQFMGTLGPLSTPALTTYLDTLAAQDIQLTDGATLEVNLQALGWMKSVGHLLKQGLVLTIDYGHTAQDLYGPERYKGTLLCYHQHKVSENPFVRVGLQDITSHVNFSALAQAGLDAGLELTGFTNQMSFLTGLGVEQLLSALDPESREFHTALQLLHPRGMGTTFKVLIQHKGMPMPALDGLRFKAFFEASLLPGSVTNGAQSVGVA
jgi:SAM-dependent MidA family methyltransferase